MGWAAHCRQGWKKHNYLIYHYDMWLLQKDNSINFVERWGTNNKEIMWIGTVYATTICSQWMTERDVMDWSTKIEKKLYIHIKSVFYGTWILLYCLSKTCESIMEAPKPINKAINGFTVMPLKLSFSVWLIQVNQNSVDCKSQTIVQNTCRLIKETLRN